MSKTASRSAFLGFSLLANDQDRHKDPISECGFLSCRVSHVENEARYRFHVRSYHNAYGLNYKAETAFKLDWGDSTGRNLSLDAASMVGGILACQDLLNQCASKQENTESKSMVVYSYDPIGLILCILVKLSDKVDKLILVDDSEWRRKRALESLGCDHAYSRVEWKTQTEVLPESCQSISTLDFGNVCKMIDTIIQSATDDQIQNAWAFMRSHEQYFEHALDRIISHRFPKSYADRAFRLDDCGIVILDLEDTMADVLYQPVIKLDLHIPSLEKVCSILEPALQQNFEQVHVSTVSCPDLTQWDLFQAGLGESGQGSLIDIGGNPYMESPTEHHRRFDLERIVDMCDLPKPSYLIGPGAGSARIHRVNCELMCNCKIDGRSESSRSQFRHKVALINWNNKFILNPCFASECGPLANIFASTGEAEQQVIKIDVKSRKGPMDFVHCIRSALMQYCETEGLDQAIGMGGVFQILSGSIKAHIMPDFCNEQLAVKEDDVQKWLRFYEATPKKALTALSYFVTHDPTPNQQLGLRFEHSHFFEEHPEHFEGGCGGHYHYDITPETIHYVGYYVVAKHLYRVSQPGAHTT